ncbi:aminopeptidase N-like [Pseudomyrmex gracilis]|uniref:aminopeptidase N-like n=1 Tax=Pseudomyrmex gracilis TaxID=219809 RepID=UPI000995D62D|nr:aminopeptidase N-like [Pseudomyrmex gracilis]
MKNPVQSGKYVITSIYKCKVTEFVTVDTYISRTETKEFLLLSRIPNEWIFPYWEHPATKARFTIQIIHKYSDTALSNMPYDYWGPVINAFQTTFFTTPLISTHLVAFVVIPNVYNTTTISGNNVTITSSLEMRNDTYYARTFLINIFISLRNMWDDIIPRSHVSYVLLPLTSNRYESMITPGFVFLSEVNSIYNREVHSSVKQREVTCFISRNVIQEMFSEWVATFKQTDSWFIEGFSTVYGVYILDKSLMKSIVVQTRRNVLDYAEAFSTYDFGIQEKSCTARNSTVRKMWREKAFGIFYMLSHIFIEEDFLYTSMFKQAVNLYYNTDTISDNIYKDLSILNKLWYWNFEASLNKATYFPKYIKRILTVWTAEVGYPVLYVKRVNDTQVAISVIDCFTVDHKKQCELNWWIPVTVKKIMETKVTVMYYDILTPYRTYIISSLFNKNEFVIVANSAGYRVNYDRESWTRIAFFLKTGDLKITDLSDVTVAQILDDAFYFLVQNTEYNDNSTSNNSDLDIYLEIASSTFYANNSYIMWYPILFALESMSKIFSFRETVVTRIIKDRLLIILYRFLDNISYTQFPENSVNNQFYHEVLKWTCILGDVTCKEHVNRILEWHFKNPALNKLLPSWQKWIYCQGVMLENVTYDNSALWQKIFHVYQTQGKEKEFLEFLPCSRKYEDMYNFLYFLARNFLPAPGSSLTAKTNNTRNIINAKKSDTITVLFTIFALHSKNDSALNKIRFGLESGIVRDVNILPVINCIINNIYSHYDLSMITNEMFLQKFVHIYMIKESYVLDAIKEKVEYRRNFLSKMQTTIRYKPQYVFNYKHMKI